jgi:hypothetical protein
VVVVVAVHDLEQQILLPQVDKVVEVMVDLEHLLTTQPIQPQELLIAEVVEVEPVGVVPKLVLPVVLVLLLLDI